MAVLIALIYVLGRPGNTTQGVTEGETFSTQFAVHVRCGHFIMYIQIFYFIP